MADTLKSVYTKSNGTAERKILDGAGSNIVYTILSITICNTDASARTFHLFVNDTDNESGVGANTDFYIYKNQSMPTHSTFIHNDKMVMKHNTELILQTVEDTTGVHIMVTYLEQTA